MSDLLTEVQARRKLADPRLARAIREAAGASQQRIAQHLGVADSTVQRWETGKRRPRGHLLVRYVQLLEQLRREVEL
ncbi:MAG: helix-turn-helix domain-containing protein [Actinomycetota bacterium]|nr:helix-turn-helix domain-containing protein [Actinomycetota bacterium]